MKIEFKPWAPTLVSYRAVTQADEIITEYQAQGFKLTLRQIYYKFVARDLFPDDRRWRWTGSRWVRDPNGTKNAEPNYTWLGDLLNDGRLAGLIDWEAIEDRGRTLRELAHWETPSSIINACAEQFRCDLWVGQPYHVELWVEKDALLGIVQRTAERYDVPCFSSRGYASVTALYEAAKRFTKCEEQGQQPVIIHLADHDPSGIDMTRDIADRLGVFGLAVDVRRVALTMDQVDEYNPPPNPAKISDSRCAAYIQEYGYSSWELDALEPQVMDSVMSGAIEELIDRAMFEKRERLVASGRRKLTRVAKELAPKRRGKR